MSPIRQKKIVLSGFISSLIIASAVIAYFQFNSELTIKVFSNPKSRYASPATDGQVNHALNSQRVSLGKMLFFDPRLSGSNWISCSTCHNPTMGWSDGLPTAIGEGQQKLKRATPTILNTAFNFLQMWDGRFSSLEEQALGPIASKDEMNQDPDELVKELKAISGYVELFNEAFPGQGVTKETVAASLASFQRTIVSGEAPFDRWINGDEDAISFAAKRGFKLFEGKAHCSTCHSGYNFTDDGFHNIGLKSKDPGRHAVVPLPVTKGAFKTPTLRDVAKTAPYMHNGQYVTLEEVIDHYVRGGDDKSNLSPNFKAAELDEAEKQDLKEFLKTLTGQPREIAVPHLPS
ncbi:MAG: c-type cytochrome [Gammaproteobacteria bacterium]|nr:c-type cytochrome [Gammaproteobacteria bacterium]